MEKRESLESGQALFSINQNIAILATNPEHSTREAAMEKINPIPARPYTGSFELILILSRG